MLTAVKDQKYLYKNIVHHCPFIVIYRRRDNLCKLVYTTQWFFRDLQY